MECLEREGKFRCVSVHGHLDIVTMLPNSFIRKSKRRFCQSGFELVLNSESSKFYVHRSEQQNDKYFQRLGLAVFKPHKIADRHHYLTYLKELELLERPLHKLHLNDFYDKFVDQSLFPCSKKKMTPSVVRSSIHNWRDNVVVLEQPTKKERKRVLSADDFIDQELSL